MANETGDPSADRPPDFASFAEQFVRVLVDQQVLGAIGEDFANRFVFVASKVLAWVLTIAASGGAVLANSIAEAENQSQPAFQKLAASAIRDMFGIDPGTLETARGTGGNRAAADAIGAALLVAFSGQASGGTAPSGQLEPSDQPAKNFLSAMAQLALEGWLEGWIVEAMSLGQIETFAELDDTISHVLGLGRASAAVHGPLVRHLIVEPLEWKLNKEHTPTLLSASTAIRQFMRGRWDWPDVVEELARQGYSEERIDALVNEQRKFLTVDEANAYAHRVGVSNFDPVPYLQDAGYDKRDAELHFTASEARRLQAREIQLADAHLAAFVAGDITLETFRSGIDAIKLPADDTEHYYRLGALRRELALTPLSDGDAQMAVKKRIQTFAWYRAYLARRGFDQDGIDTKELLLRAEIEAEASVEDLRARQAAERAAEKAESDQARADRIAAKAIADALPAFAEIRRGFVRGLVSLERLQLAIEQTHPGIDAADAAAIAVDAQLDRETYLEQQAARAAALAADTDTALPLATLEQSVLRGITTLDAFDRELVRRQYSDENRRILVALLRGRLDDQARAREAQLGAERRAQLRGISVADFTRAVRLGLRTIDELAALLDQLETPTVEKGLILDLLRADVQRDDDARAKRAAADAAAAARAINLPLRRRAVINGVRAVEQYADDLAAAGVELEDRTLELELVRLEAEAAAAARDRAAQLEAERAAREAQLDEPTLTLAQTEHAVKLGILAPDDLRAYLRERRYNDDDVETLVSTVVADIPDLRAAQREQTTATRELGAKGLDLAALERAVARGLRTLDDYRAELAARGKSDDAIALLAGLLEEKVAIDLDALRDKVSAKLAGVDGGPSLEELEHAITDQTVDAATLQRFLIGIGVARDVALVYMRLVPLYRDATGAGGS